MIHVIVHSPTEAEAVTPRPLGSGIQALAPHKRVLSHSVAITCTGSRKYGVWFRVLVGMILTSNRQSSQLAFVKYDPSTWRMRLIFLKYRERELSNSLCRIFIWPFTSYIMPYGTKV